MGRILWCVFGKVLILHISLITNRVQLSVSSIVVHRSNQRTLFELTCENLPGFVHDRSVTTVNIV